MSNLEFMLARKLLLLYGMELQFWVSLIVYSGFYTSLCNSFNIRNVCVPFFCNVLSQDGFYKLVGIAELSSTTFLSTPPAHLHCSS